MFCLRQLLPQPPSTKRVNLALLLNLAFHNITALCRIVKFAITLILNRALESGWNSVELAPKASLRHRLLLDANSKMIWNEVLSITKNLSFCLHRLLNVISIAPNNKLTLGFPSDLSVALTTKYFL